MNDLLNLGTILMRILVDIPMTMFLWHQYKYRHLNGAIKMVRKITSLWVAAFMLQHNYQLFLRILIAGGYNINTVPLNTIVLVITAILFVMSAYATYLFIRLIKSHN